MCCSESWITHCKEQRHVSWLHRGQPLQQQQPVRDALRLIMMDQFSVCSVTDWRTEQQHAACPPTGRKIEPISVVISRPLRQFRQLSQAVIWRLSVLYHPLTFRTCQLYRTVRTFTSYNYSSFFALAAFVVCYSLIASDGALDGTPSLAAS